MKESTVDKEGRTSLHLAVIKKNYEKIKEELLKGEDPVAEDGYGRTPFHYVEDLESLDLLCEKALLEKVTTLEHLKIPDAQGMTLLYHIASKKDAQGMTLLHHLASKENVPIPLIRTLMMYKVDPKAKDKNGRTPADIAESNQNANMIAVLKEVGVISDSRELKYKTLIDNERAQKLQLNDKQKRTVLHIAVINNDHEKVKYELLNTDNHSLQDQYGMNPFHYVEDKKILDSFLVEIGYPNLLDAQGMTLLHHLASKKNVSSESLIKSLTDSGADVNAKDKDGKTPLDIAEANQNSNMIKALVAKGARYSVLASEKGKDELEKLIKEGGSTNINGKDSLGNSPIHYVKDKESLQILLNAGANINAQNNDGMTILHLVARNKDFDMMKALIDAGADINIKDKQGKTAGSLLAGSDKKKYQSLIIDEQGRTTLHLLAIRGDLDSIKNLLATQADVNARDNNGMTPIDYALRNAKNQAITEILFEKGAKVSNVVDENGMTPLHYAAKQGLTSLVRDLLQQDYDPNARDQKGNTALDYAKQSMTPEQIKSLESLFNKGKSTLHLAAEKGKDELVELIKGGRTINLNGKDNLGNRPIHYVKDKESLQILIKAGATIDAKNNDGMTILHLAARNKDFDMMKALIDAGANINIQDKQGKTAGSLLAGSDKKKYQSLIIDEQGRTILHLAIMENNLDLATKLLEDGADVNARDKEGRTPLYYVKNKESLELLVSKKANLNAVDNRGKTYLHIAVMAKKNEMVQALIEKEADVNARDKDGRTPLHYVQNKESVELLLSKQADINAVDKQGMTPLHTGAMLFTKNPEALEALEALLEGGANTDVRNKIGMTPLQYMKDKELLQPLLNKFATVADDVVDEYGRTPLHHAVMKGSEKLTKSLLDSGADINARDFQGKTPVDYAVEKGNSQYNNFLLRNILVKGSADTIRTLLDAGVDLPDLKLTDLHVAVMKGDVNKIKEIKEISPGGLIVDQDYRTPLHYLKDKASLDALLSDDMREDPVFVEYIINSKDKEGKTPLDYAIEGGRTELQEALIEAGAEVSNPTKTKGKQQSQTQHQETSITEKQEQKTPNNLEMAFNTMVNSWRQLPEKASELLQDARKAMSKQNDKSKRQGSRVLTKITTLQQEGVDKAR